MESMIQVPTDHRWVVGSPRLVGARDVTGEDGGQSLADRDLCPGPDACFPR
jgi:hypothetical protein